MKLHGIWRGDEDRDAAPREPGEERYDVLVEQQSLAPQRLIEKDRARRAYERLRESQPLQQAGREVAHSTGRVYPQNVKLAVPVTREEEKDFKALQEGERLGVARGDQ